MSVKNLTAAVALLLILAVESVHANLIVTGVFDGPLAGGEPKVVELIATTAIADLSRYGVGSANNGGGTDGVENILSGSASAGDYIYIVDDNTGGPLGTSFASYFGFTPTLIFDSNLGTSGGAAAINGDDAVEVFFDPTGAFTGGQTVIDVFGEITHAGAGAWNYLDGWAYRNDGTGPDGSTFVIGNWTFSGIDANDGKSTNSPPNAFPIGSYVIPEPTGWALALVGLASLAGRRRRNNGR